ncbi:MAG: Glutamine--tRNA ligase [Candidatus Marinimicrobia bacterium]|nr:Glutamine--tRNA ligase [Candidatus Neomarinimicrobiota bacterium]
MNTQNSNFIKGIIDRDLADGTYKSIVTRFPPEPNGYLHIGHAKSVVLNFGLAEEYNGRCHLRFDDTNPETENEEYIRSIKETVAWLGFDWGEHLYFASAYFEQFYKYAQKLIKDGKAYVDSQNETEIRENRGTVNEPGKPSLYRNRTVEENLALFHEMREGKYRNGEHVLRARIDMASPHMILRDPLLYRIKHAYHYLQGDDWCIYPMYDFAHPLEDAIEDVTHSLCTLEFDTNRVLYDWVLENCLKPEELPTRPHQYEFARLNLTYTIMGKRKLLRLVNENLVTGWDDPRLPTIAGLRKRGVPAAAIREFCRSIGVTRTESTVEMSHFEHVLRDHLNFIAPRINAVTEPLKVVITNFPEGKTDWVEGSYWPRDVDKEGSRKIPFTRELYIERDDFRENPPDGFYRLAPGREVRLRYGYFVTCEKVVKNDAGEIDYLECTYDPETRGGDAPNGRNPGGTLHWVSAMHGVPAEFREYNRLFKSADPESGDEDFTEHLNPGSLTVVRGYVEPDVREHPTDERFQFERIGYFWQDPDESTPDHLIFNQIVPLRDTWTEKEGTESQAEIEQKRRERELEKQRQRERSSAGDRYPWEDLSGSQRVTFQRYVDEYSLDRENAAIIARDDDLSGFFEEALTAYENASAVAKWMVNKLLAVHKETPVNQMKVSPEQFGAYVEMISTDVISTRAADDVFDEMLETGDDPSDIVEREGLQQVSDEGALEPVIEKILADNPDKVERYRDGQKGLLGFFMGQVMRETGGTANPELTKEILSQMLNN